MCIRITGQGGHFSELKHLRRDKAPHKGGHSQPGEAQDALILAHSVFFPRGSSVSVDWELGKFSTVILSEEVGLCKGRPRTIYSIRM